MLYCWFKTLQSNYVERCFICRNLIGNIENVRQVGCLRVTTCYGPWYVAHYPVPAVLGLSDGVTGPPLCGVVRGGRQWAWDIGDTDRHPTALCLR